MTAQSKRNKNKQNKREKSSFLMTLSIIIVVMFLIGFFGMGLILKSLNHDAESVEITSETTQSEIESDEETLQDVNAAFDSIKLYAVQVSSLSDETAAMNAVDLLGGEGIPVTYAHIGSYYKLFACLTTDESVADQFTKKIVERYPKYKDAYVTSIDMTINDFSAKSSELTGENISQKIEDLIVEYDSLINNAQIREEISTKSIQNTIGDANDFFGKIILDETEGESIISKLIIFNDALKKLVDRNANVKEYNKLWLNMIIEN